MNDDPLPGKPGGIGNYDAYVKNYSSSSTLSGNIDPVSHSNLSSDQCCAKSKITDKSKYNVPKLYPNCLGENVVKGTRSAPMLRRSASATHNNGVLRDSKLFDEDIISPLNTTCMNDDKDVQKSKRLILSKHSPASQRNNHF